MLWIKKTDEGVVAVKGEGIHADLLSMQKSAGDAYEEEEMWQTMSLGLAKFAVKCIINGETNGYRMPKWTEAKDALNSGKMH